MTKTPVHATEAAVAADEAAPAPRKRAPKAGKANGAAPVKAKANGAKPVKAKAAKAAKAAKPAKGAKAKAKPVARTIDPAKLDQFGFRKGTLKSQAAAMYAKGKGSTIEAVKAALGSVQFNLLSELEEKGYTIEKSQIPGDGPRKVTRYHLQPK